jgi:hypothetical protein
MADGHGGPRPGSGRKPGSPNKAKAALSTYAKAEAALIDADIPPFEGDALAFLVWCYKNTSLPIGFRVGLCACGAAVRKAAAAVDRAHRQGWRLDPPRADSDSGDGRTREADAARATRQTGRCGRALMGVGMGRMVTCIQKPRNCAELRRSRGSAQPMAGVAFGGGVWGPPR